MTRIIREGSILAGPLQPCLVSADWIEGWEAACQTVALALRIEGFPPERPESAPAAAQDISAEAGEEAAAAGAAGLDDYLESQAALIAAGYPPGGLSVQEHNEDLAASAAQRSLDGRKLSITVGDRHRAIEGDQTSVLVIFNNLTGANFSDPKRQHLYLWDMGAMVFGDVLAIPAGMPVVLVSDTGAELSRQVVAAGDPRRVTSASILTESPDTATPHGEESISDTATVIADIVARDPAYGTAMATGKKAGDANMEKCGRTEWNDEDYQVAAHVRDAQMSGSQSACSTPE